MNCPKCNRENEDSALFCRYCGSSLKPIVKKDGNGNNDGCFQWVIWIGTLLLLNLLSWIFDWSFWVY